VPSAPVSGALAIGIAPRALDMLFGGSRKAMEMMRWPSASRLPVIDAEDLLLREQPGKQLAARQIARGAHEHDDMRRLRPHTCWNLRHDASLLPYARNSRGENNK